MTTSPHCDFLYALQAGSVEAFCRRLIAALEPFAVNPLTLLCANGEGTSGVTDRDSTPGRFDLELDGESAFFLF